MDTVQDGKQLTRKFRAESQLVTQGVDEATPGRRRKWTYLQTQHSTAQHHHNCHQMTQGVLSHELGHHLKAKVGLC